MGRETFWFSEQQYIRLMESAKTSAGHERSEIMTLPSKVTSIRQLPVCAVHSSYYHTAVS